MTTTYTNGYAILFGIADDAQKKAILDFMKKQDFIVPGPYHIPPVHLDDKPQNPPGVYCNGGCGWGRGIMPSIGLACYEQNRWEQGFDYLKRQGTAACKAGSFHEYWTWEKYTGSTKPGGASWYGETSAGFLDVLLHGTFGISSNEPGFKSLQLTPKFPKQWPFAHLELCLPNGSRLIVHYQNNSEFISLTVKTDGSLMIIIRLPWFGNESPIIEGTNLTQSKIEHQDLYWFGLGQIQGNGEIRLKKA
jgi:hypothetical protein